MYSQTRRKDKVRKQKKILPAVIALLLVASMVAMMLGPTGKMAEALSAVSVATQGTATSVSTTQWQQVYVNGTENTLLLDFTAAGKLRKVEYDSGTITSTDSGTRNFTATRTDDGFATTPTASVASSTDAAGVMWYSETSNTGDSTLNIDVDVGFASVGQKVSSTSSPLYDKPVNAVAFELADSGLPTGSMTANVFNAAVGSGTENEVFEFGTLSFSSIPDAVEAWFWFNHTSFIIMSNTDYAVGVNAQGGSSGLLEIQYYGSSVEANTFQAEFLPPGNVWADQASRDLKAQIGFRPALTYLDDNTVQSFWRNNASSEASAYVYVDQGSSKPVRGVKAYFNDATEIPASLNIYVSNNASDFGSVVEVWNTDNVAGWQSFNFTSSFVEGRYVKVEVNTWGSDTRWRMGELQTLVAPTISANGFVSSVETNSTTYITGRDTTGGAVGIGYINLNTLEVVEDYIDYFTTSYVPKDIEQSKTKVYVAAVDGSNNLKLLIQNRNMTTGFTEVALGDAMLAGGFVHMVVYDGSPDTVYIVYTDAATVVKVAKYANSASILGTTITQASNADFAVFPLSDRFVVQTNNRVYEVAKASDTITQVHGNTFLTYYPQTFTLDADGSRTYDSDSTGVYMANTTYAKTYTPSTGASERSYLIVDTVTVANSKGKLEFLDSAKYYLIDSRALAIDASTTAGTTWNIKTVGTKLDLSVTLYAESLNVPLTEDKTILNDDVVSILCDAAHQLNTTGFERFSIGSDSDCISFNVLDDPANNDPRTIKPYTRTVDLVHTDEYRIYAFEVAASDPSALIFRSTYDDKLVDSAQFDAAGQVNQRYLNGQCYEAEVQNTNNGDISILGNVCANEFTTKDLNFLTVRIPQGWLGAQWYWNTSRSYDQDNDGVDEANVLKFDIKKSKTPYNITIHFTDHFDAKFATYDKSFNFTGQSGMASVILNDIYNNQTIYIDAYENDRRVVNDVSGAQDMNIEFKFVTSLGSSFFGVPIASAAGMMAVLIVGAIFTKSNAHFGVLVVGGTAGLLLAWGLLSVPAEFWALAVVIAIIGVLAKKFVFN